MKPPTYEANTLGTWTCSMCGCAIANPAKHTSWHEALVRVLGLNHDDM